MSKFIFFNVVCAFVFWGFVSEPALANDVVEIPERVIFIKGDSTQIDGEVSQ